MLCFILLFVCSVGAHAYYYKQFTTSNHLISNEVYHAYRDHKGYMWFFTNKGISKFDGVSFKNFTLSDGLTDNSVFSGYEDNSGRLWIYTFNGRPCFIRNDTVYNEDNCPLLKKVPSISFMQYIYEKGPALYMAYKNGELIRLEGNKCTVLHKQIGDDQTFALAMTGDTMIMYNGFSTFYLKDDKVISAKSEKERVVFHDFKKLLTLTDEGIKILDDHDNIFWQYNDPAVNRHNVKHIYFDDIENVFCSTNSGLFVINTRTKVKTKLFENISIHSTAQGIYGNYWITTENNGVYYLDKNLDKIKPLRVDANAHAYFLGSDQIFFVEKDKTVLYLNNDSLHKLKPPAYRKCQPQLITDKYFIYRNDDSTFIMNIAGNKPEENIQRAYFNMYKVAADSFLGVGGNGYAIIAPSKNKFHATDYNLPHYSRVNCMYKHDAIFFAANNKRISRLDIHSGNITSISDADTTLFVEKMYCLQNYLLVITSDKKVIVYDIDHQYQKKVITGLPFICYSILPICNDKTNYLLNTDKGYYIFNDPNNIDAGAQPFEYPVGQPDLFALCPSRQYIVCNMNGSYYIFHDSLINKERQKPVLLISKVLINGTQYSGKRFYVKNNLQAHIAISLNSLKFLGDAGGYEYRILSSKASPWYRSASDNLDIFLQKTGDYRIEIRSVANNDVVSQSKFIEITVLPPFYYSFNFYLLIAVVAAIVISLGLKFYNQRRLRAFRNELNYLQLEHKAINSLLNPHFIFNAINNIQSLVNHNANDTANSYLAILSKLIRQNMENLQFNFISVSKELNLVRNYIQLQNLRFDNRITLEIDSTVDDLDNINIPPLLIHTFVENSVVHGFKKDNSNFIITVELSLSVDDYLIVRVIDNGVGLSQKKNNATSDKTSMGIDFIHKRLTRLSEFYKVTYSLDIHNVSGGNTGTEVIVILYAKFANENMLVSLN